MSYKISIGQIVRNTTTEIPLSFLVERVTHPEAPVFEGDEFTGNGNTREPSYSGWEHFTREVGVYDLFYHKCYGLMRTHPGTFPVDDNHATHITNALKTYQERHPEAVPHFGSQATFVDACMARLLWLDWWVQYALQTSEHPGICNR